MKPSIQLTTAVLSALTLSGCATMDRAYQKTAGIVSPETATLRGGIRWMTPPLEMGLRPPVNSEQMTVFLRLKNSSGSDLPNLLPQLRASLEEAGYRIAEDMNAAHFCLIADARFLGENSRRDEGGALLTGGAIGAATGAIIGHNIGDKGTAGAIGGAVLGAAAANVLANRNRMVEINLVVDLRLGERIPGGIKTTTSTDTSAKLAHSERAGGQGGDTKAGTTQRQQTEVTEQFLFRNNRVVAHATRRGLTTQEGLAFLSSKLVSAISNALP